MAKYAYRDNKRREIIYSADAVREDRDKAFFCPNPNCGARLYVCAIDGSRNAYFRASKAGYPHSSECPFGSSNAEFDERQFDPYQFLFDDAMDHLYTATKTRKNSTISGEHKKGETKKHPPRTLRQIYAMCKSFPVNYLYGNKKIGEMILDDRSEYRYPEGCYGNIIIEAVAKRRIYDNKSKQIYLAAPVISKKYSFTLCFSDVNTYRIIRDEVYCNQGKILVVAGKWKSSGIRGCFATEVIGQKQIAVIK
ncbi:hypothetical protein V1224_05665 [Lachnospiraceae bacterium JLR.KK008]